MDQSRLQQLQQFLAEAPDDAFILFAIAKEYEKMGQPEQALEQFSHLKDVHPDYVGLYYHLGKLYEAKGEAQLAWNTYSTGIAIASRIGDQHARNELAGARLNLGDEEDFME